MYHIPLYIGTTTSLSIRAINIVLGQKEKEKRKRFYNLVPNLMLKG